MRCSETATLRTRALAPVRGYWRARVARLIAALGLAMASLVLLAVAPTHASAAVVTVSGVISGWDPGCDGVAQKVALRVNTGAVTTTSCTAGSLTWTKSVTLTAAGDTVTVWLDTNGVGDKGSITTISADATSNISGLGIVNRQARINRQGAAAITNTNLDTTDSGFDTDIPYTVTGGALTMTGYEKLVIDVGSDYAPGGNVTAAAIANYGTFTGGANTITLTERGTGATCNQDVGTMQPLCNGGTLSLASATVKYTSTQDVQGPPAGTYGALEMKPSAAGHPTYNLGAVANAAVTVNGAMTLGDGTNAVSVRNDYSPDITVGGVLTVNGSAQLVGGGAGSITVGGNVTGAGSISLTNGVFEQRGSAAATFGQTGAGAWIFNDLRLSNSGGAGRTVTTSGAPIIAKKLTIGRAADGFSTTLDNNVNDSSLQIEGLLNVTTKGALTASNITQLVLSGGFTNDGTFTHSNGVVQLTDVSQTSVIRHAGATTFGTLTVQAGKSVQFDTVSQTNVATLTAGSGGTCGTTAALTSTLPGTRAALNVTTLATVTYANITDINAIAAITATNSFDSGNNLNMTITGTCTTINVSGTAYGNETGGVWSGCDGATQRIAISVHGGPQQKAACNAGTGAWTIAVVAGTDLSFAVYFDQATTADRAVTYSRTIDGVTALTGIDIIKDRVTMRSETATVTTSRDIGMWDSTMNSSIPLTVTYDHGSRGNDMGWNISLPGTTMEVRIPAGESFSSNGDLQTWALDVRGTFTLTTTHSLFLHGPGSSNTCNNTVGTATPLCVDTPGGATFTAPTTSTTVFTNTAGASIADVTYGALSIEPASGTQTFTAGTSGTRKTITAYTLDVSGAGSSTLDLGAWAAQLTSTRTCVGQGYSSESSVSIGSGDTISGAGSLTTSCHLHVNAGTVSALTSLNITGSGSALWISGGLVSLGASSVYHADGQVIATGGSVQVNAGRVESPMVSAYYTAVINGGSGEIHVTSTFSSYYGATWTPGTSTVFFEGAANTISTDGGSMSFYNLRSATPSSFLSLPASPTVNVTGTTGTYPGLTVDGSACGTQTRLVGNGGTLNVTGTKSVQYARIENLTAAVGITANSSSTVGTTTGWTINRCQIAVSGTARESEAGGQWSQCSGAANISASAGGRTKETDVTCNPGTGAFSINVGVNDPGEVIVVFMDSGIAGQTGATYFTNASMTAPIVSISVFKGVVDLACPAGGNCNATNARVLTYDQTNDADIPINVTGANAVTDAGVGIRVDTGSNYTPGGTVTTDGLDLRGSYKSTAISNDLTTIRGSGVGTDCDAGIGTEMPLCLSGTPANQRLWNFSFLGTGNTTVPGQADMRFQTLTIAPTSGTPTYTIGSAAGQVIGTYGNVTIGSGTSTVTVNVSNAFNTGFKVGAYCPSGAGSCGIAGNVTVNAMATFGGGGAVQTWGNVSGAGTVNFTGGTFTRHDFSNIGGSSAGFGSTSGANVWTFNNLTFDICDSVANTISMNAGGTGATKVTGVLSIAGGVTLDDSVNNRDFDIDGSVSIAASSQLKAPSSTATVFTIGDDFTNNGTFTPGTSTITFDTAANTSDLTYSAATTFYNLRIATGSKSVRFDHVDQTNVTGTTGANPGFSVAGGACATQIAIDSMQAGTRAALNVTGTKSVDRADLQDINAIVAITAGNSNDSGNNLNWTINNGACATMALSITAGSAPTIGPAPLQPGEDGSAQSTVHVVTNSTTGYTLRATDPSDTVSLVRSPATDTVGDYTTLEPTAPSVWAVGNSGADGMFGLTVLSASGGRLAKWGGGTSLATDYATNTYLGLGLAAPAILHTTAGATAGDDIVAAYRLNVPITTLAGSYSVDVTYTATVNP